MWWQNHLTAHIGWTLPRLDSRKRSRNFDFSKGLIAELLLPIVKSLGTDDMQPAPFFTSQSAGDVSIGPVKPLLVTDFVCDLIHKIIASLDYSRKNLRFF